MLEDLEKDHAKAMQKKERELKAMEERALRAERRLDEKSDEYREKCKELYQAKTELEEEQGKNQKLKAQINRDHENSSLTSASKPKRKKIANNPNFKPTGRIIRKQMVDIRVEIKTTEYFTEEYRNVLTGQRVHAEFPDGMVNEVNYSGNIKSFAFLLNNRYNVSIANVSDLLSELTGGDLKISTGMICGLSKEFSQKTEAEQKKAFADLLLSPVMNTDLTSVRVNGKNMNVAVCATPSTVMYFAKEHKGHEAIKDTPVEEYQNTLVHDHDKTYYNYGGEHAECNQHPMRELKGCAENEPERKWYEQMRTLFREMIHFINGLCSEDERNPDEIDPGRVEALEARYNEILALAKEEYEYEPPTKYNKDGFNLYKRLEEYKANHLLFLHDRRVPATNNCRRGCCGASSVKWLRQWHSGASKAWTIYAGLWARSLRCAQKARTYTRASQPYMTGRNLKRRKARNEPVAN